MILSVLLQIAICPKPNTCCSGCCNPNTHCCVGGTDGNCVPIPECDSCTEDYSSGDCECIPKNNGCGPGQTPCGFGCCNFDQVCTTMGGGCTCASI